MRLQRLILHNYRGFERLELDFDHDLTVLVAPNGAGKTTVLDAIASTMSSSHVGAANIRAGATDCRVGVHLVDGRTFGREATHDTTNHEGRLEPADAVLYYQVRRSTSDQTPPVGPAASRRPDQASVGWDDAGASYASFFAWFREMEDRENERIRYGEGGELPELEAVRRTITRFFPEFTQLRVRREFAPFTTKPALTLAKGDAVLTFDALSEGERSALAMVADIARRLVLLDPSAPDPLAHEVVLLIDEFEQHLHPAAQRHLIRTLPEVFPGAQLVITTHSPVIVSEVGPANLRVFQDFRLIEPLHGRGRDANAVLEDTFSTTARPKDAQDNLDKVSDLLDEDRLDEARQLLDELGSELGATDPDVVFYTQLHARLSAPST